MAKLQLDDEVPELPDDEIKKHRDFTRVQTRYQLVSHGLRNRRLNRFKNKYWFLAVLMLLLMLVFLLTEI